MLNAEKYKEELKLINKQGLIALQNGKPVPCEGIECKECDLRPRFHPEEPSCREQRIDWMLSEVEA